MHHTCLYISLPVFGRKQTTLLRRLSHPPFFLLVNFSPALFNLKAWNNRLPWNLHLLARGSVVSYLCQEPSDELVPLLARLFVFTGFCHILRLGFFCCVLFSYTYHIGMQTNCSIFLASKSSVRSFTFTTLVSFHVTHHVTVLDQ